MVFKQKGTLFSFIQFSQITMNAKKFVAPVGTNTHIC